MNLFGKRNLRLPIVEPRCPRVGGFFSYLEHTTARLGPGLQAYSSVPAESACTTGRDRHAGHHLPERELKVRQSHHPSLLRSFAPTSVSAPGIRWEGGWRTVYSRAKTGSGNVPIRDICE